MLEQDYEIHQKDTNPFSEKEMQEIGPECPGKFATLAFSFKSQILMTLKNEFKSSERI